MSGGCSPRSSAAAAALTVSPVPVSSEPISGGTSAPQTPVSQVSAMHPTVARARRVPAVGVDEAATRAEYPFRMPITTRWKDNDVYGHVNNVEYYSFFDTAINAWLIREGGLDIHRGTVIGLCAESHCAFHAALEFPGTVECGVRVARLGRSSVRYELALFADGLDGPAATGWFVHVFVDRASRRPADLPGELRAALERL